MAITFFYVSPHSCLKRMLTRESIFYKCHWNETCVRIIGDIIFRV